LNQFTLNMLYLEMLTSGYLNDNNNSHQLEDVFIKTSDGVGNYFNFISYVVFHQWFLYPLKRGSGCCFMPN
jgi:hypothetical protein